MKRKDSASFSNNSIFTNLSILLLQGFALLALVSAGSALAAGSTEQVLYQFQGGSDGEFPSVGLVTDKAGNFYGTTSNGGGSSNCTDGCGIVFELSPPAERGGAWIYAILHTFEGGADGGSPQTALVFDSAGNLWGGTGEGGSGDCSAIGQLGCGTVFELTESGTSWNYQTIYSFQGVPSGQGTRDAASPSGIAFDEHGNLYGVAYSGGRCWTDAAGTGCTGAAFELTNSNGNWTESVIYDFNGPYFGYVAGPIIDPAGNLYLAGPGGLYGYGAVFRLQPPKNGQTWTEHGIYNFKGEGDGAFPTAGIVFDQHGNIYGTSWGTSGASADVFEVSPTKIGEWTLTDLFNFDTENTGVTPNWGPILGKDGNLYGTTEDGGHFGRGTVYQLVPPSMQGERWTENILYSFNSSGTSGFAPQSGLIFGKDGAIYGTAGVGGDASCGISGNGCGTVFRVVP